MKFAFAALLLCLSTSFAKADIAIGVAGPFSGANASFGQEMRIGVNAAVKATNDAGGINGEMLVTVEGDDGCDARRAVDVAKTFVSKDVRLVVGHFCSGSSLAAAPTYAANGILMITPSASLPDLTSKSLWPVFRLTGRDDLQAELVAAKIKADGNAVNALVVTDGQTSTAQQVLKFKNALPAAHVVQVKAGSPQLPDDPEILSATAVYLALQATDAGTIVQALRFINQATAFYGTDLLQDESFATRGEGAANQTQITIATDFAAKADPRRIAQLSSTEGATLSSYAAVESFVAAAKARNVNDARGIAQWLSAGNRVNTIVGDIQFNPSGDLQQQPYDWYSWQDGKLSKQANME